MQLQLSTAASLRANWLGIITVDVLPMADSEDKLGSITKASSKHAHSNLCILKRHTERGALKRVMNCRYVRRWQGDY